MRILSLLIFVVLSFISFGQHTFFKLYTDGGDDYANGVVELADSTFAITGNSSSFWAGQGQAFILKIDAEGNYVWSNHYGGSESDGGEKILYKENDGFYVAGYTNSFGNGGFDFYLFKTDLDGNLLWEKTYGGEGWERVHDAHLTRDGGVLMIGETSSNSTYDTDMWFVKTDANGDTLWTKTMGSNGGEDIAKTMFSITDSSFVIASSSYMEDSSLIKIRLTEFFDDGSLGWDTTNIGPNGNTYPEDVIIFNNIAYTVGYSDIGQEGESVNFFALMNIQDFSGYGYNEAQVGKKRAKTISTSWDPNVLYIGYEYFSPTSPDYEFDAIISRFDIGYGFLSTLQPIAFYDQDGLKETIPTQDGGTITVGFSDGDINIGDKHSFAMKTLPNDSIPGWITLPDVTQLVTVDEIKELKENTSIFPNPAKDIVTIDVGFSGEFEYVVLDINGRSLAESKTTGTAQLDVSTYESGVYFVRIKQNNIWADFKLMID